MKKTLIALFSGLLLAGLCACGGESAPAPTAEPAPADTAAPAAPETPAPVESESPAAAEAPAAASPDYGPLGFDYAGLHFGIFDEAAPILEALGAPADTFVADSCAYQGSDCYYYYDGIELCVNNVDGVERITGITLADDTVQTPQGLRIGMDLADAVGRMELEARESGGVYSFSYGSTMLRVRGDANGAVAAIAYIPAE